MTSIAPIWPRLELLEEIDVANVAALGDIVLPNLRRASFDLSDPALLLSLASARWPKLEQLRLRVWPETATADQFLAVFANELPRLRSVELEFGQPAPALLPRLKLPQLAELDVRATAEIVDALTRCTFDLEVLRIHGSMYPDPRPRLQHLAKLVELV